MKSFRLAKKDELQEVAALLTDSFLEYPLFPLILTQDKDYKKTCIDLIILIQNHIISKVRAL